VSAVVVNEHGGAADDEDQVVTLSWRRVEQRDEARGVHERRLRDALT